MQSKIIFHSAIDSALSPWVPLIEAWVFTMRMCVPMQNVFFLLQNLGRFEDAASVRRVLNLSVRAAGLNGTVLHELDILEAHGLPWLHFCSKLVCPSTRGDAVLLQAVLVIRQPILFVDGILRATERAYPGPGAHRSSDAADESLLAVFEGFGYRRDAKDQQDTSRFCHGPEERSSECIRCIARPSIRLGNTGIKAASGARARAE